ncbi:MAG: chaperone NapD [Peptococcaceae bacterium]|nr:chaperone NapD [Peptococcaceae bacterium]
MAIASFVVKTDDEEQTVAVIESLNGLSVHSVTENHEIIVLAEAPTVEEIQQLGFSIQEMDENAWSVTVAYVNSETDI